MRATTGARLSLLAGIAAVVVAATGPAGAGPAAEGGRVAVVSSGDPGASSRTEGGSRTPFSLRLPSGSSCPGDSANDGYRVQSFVVPATADVATLTYRSVSPQVPGGYALYDLLTNPYIQAQTANAPAPGQPGLIINIPTFAFAVFPPGRLPAGHYHVGIACSLHNATVRYWTTDMVLTDAPGDQPGHLRWRVIDPAGQRSHGAAPSAVTFVRALGLGALGAIAALMVWRRRTVTAVAGGRHR